MKEKKRAEYSKVIASIVVGLFSAVAIAFIVFVCYEMHRLNDLTPVAYIGSGIVGLLAVVISAYMWRAKAKSQSDLEWEKTKRLTEFREKHPEHFTQGTMDPTGLTNYDNYYWDGGVG